MTRNYTAISIENLEIAYGRSQIITDLSLSIARGAVTALIGPNGCGKSTLLKSLIGIVPARSGTVSVLGQSTASMGAKALSRLMSCLPQVLPVPEGITVRQLVGFGRSPHTGLWGRLSSADRDIVDRCIERMAIKEFCKAEVSTLSGGQRQRAWIAMVLAQQTPILLMDEPTTYLDVNHQFEVLNLARELASEGTSVVMVLHDLNQAFRYADSVAIMKDGRLFAEGDPGTVATAANLAAAFDVDARVEGDPETGSPMMIVKSKGPVDRHSG